MGLQNLSIGGSDLSLMSDRVPKNMYYRSLTLSYEYNNTSVDLFKRKIPASVVFNGIPVEELTDTEE